jgi:hypothetical protein
MRTFLRSSVRRLCIGWYWVLGLLVLPNCTFNPGGLGPGPNLWPGSTPRADAIFCDIEKPLGRHCASDMEKVLGIRLSEAALALNTGRTSSIGLDYSADALSRCSGEPEAVEFQGAFPEGFSVCVNCGGVVWTASYPDVNAACVARCEDFFGTTTSDGTIIPENPPDPSVVSFCTAHAKASTSFPLDGCFAGACSEAGTLNADFVDPRRTPEPVFWRDLIGVATGGADGNDLTRTAVTTGAYDAGAVSSQWIGRGDGYLEFSVGTTTQRQVLGLSAIPSGCPSPCPDGDPNFTDIGFGIGLGLDARYYVLESGVTIAGPDVGLSFGTYSAGERFRVSLKDNDNGTATVTYSRLVGACTPGTMCNEVVFYTHTGAPATYPLRADASLFEQTATLSDVRLVRIK